MSIIKIRIMLIFCIVFTATYSYAADIAYVNMQNILKLSNVSKSAKEILDKVMKSGQAEIKVKQDDLKKQRAALMSFDRSDNTIIIMEKKYQIGLEEFKTFTLALKDKIKRLDSDYAKFILDGVESASREYILLSKHSSICIIDSTGKINCENGLLAGSKNRMPINIEDADDASDKILIILNRKKEYFQVVANSENPEATYSSLLSSLANLTKQSLRPSFSSLPDLPPKNTPGNGLQNQEKAKSELSYYDPLTGYMWARNGNIRGSWMSLEEANTWIKNLTYDGYSNWRIPTIDELTAFAKQGGDHPSDWFNANGFNGVEGLYWSATQDTLNSAFFVNMYIGQSGSGGIGVNGYVWPVRSTR